MMTPLKSKKIAWIIRRTIKGRCDSTQLPQVWQWRAFRFDQKTTAAAVRSRAHRVAAGLRSMQVRFSDSPGNQDRRASDLFLIGGSATSSKIASAEHRVFSM